MFCGRANGLSYKKRLGYSTNSTGSCRATLNEGFSYKEKIFKQLINPKTKETCFIFNSKTFSQTTTRHQSHLRSYLEKSMLNHAKVYNIELKTLNDLDNYLNKKQDLLDFFEKYIEIKENSNLNSLKEFLNDFGFSKKSQTKLFKVLTDRIEHLKTSLKRDRSRDRLRDNLKNLNYKSIQGLDKALNDYTNNLMTIELKSYPFIHFNSTLHPDLSPEKIDLLFKVLKLDHNKGHYERLKDLEPIAKRDKLSVFEALDLNELGG